MTHARLGRLDRMLHLHHRQWSGNYICLRLMNCLVESEPCFTRPRLIPYLWIVSEKRADGNTQISRFRACRTCFQPVLDRLCNEDGAARRVRVDLTNNFLRFDEVGDLGPPPPAILFKENCTHLLLIRFGFRYNQVCTCHRFWCLLQFM